MSDIPVWNCEFQPSTSEGNASLTALTVGARFSLKCHGDLAVAWDVQPPHLKFAKPEEQYTLAILKVIQQEPNSVQYEITSYKAGEFKPEYVRVLQGQGDAEKGFEFTKPTWTVRSVLTPNQQQPPQPIPSYGPWSLQLPLWFSLLIGALLLAFIYFLYRLIRRWTQRRRMLEQLKRHKTALSPLHQFYRDARQIRKRLNKINSNVNLSVNATEELKNISEDLEREFKLYVLREFQIPTLEWSDRAVLIELRRRYRKTYEVAGEPLKRTLRELRKLKARVQKNAQDLEQMHRMSLDTAERLQAEKAGVHK